MMIVMMKVVMRMIMMMTTKAMMIVMMTIATMMMMMTIATMMMMMTIATINDDDGVRLLPSSSMWRFSDSGPEDSSPYRRCLKS